MKNRCLCLAVAALAACQTSQPAGSAAMPNDAVAGVARPEPRILEASFGGAAAGTGIAKSTGIAPPTARTIHLADTISAELLQAAALVQTAEQRAHLENIANANTVGYKRRVVVTSTAQVYAADGEAFSMPKVVKLASEFTQGCMEQTQRSLDVAIDGHGFCSVLRIDGTSGYTRNGRLRLNADGKLVVGWDAMSDVTSAFVLMPEITVPSDTLEIMIAPDGVVSGRTAGSPDCMTQFGQIILHRFVSPAGLTLEGELWRPTEASGQPLTGQPGTSGLGVLKQGCLERSNVELATELLALQLLEQRRAVLVATMGRYGLQLP